MRRRHQMSKWKGQMFGKDPEGMVSWNLLDKFQMSQMFEVG